MSTYGKPCGGAEAGASVEPVIITELVDLDALLVGRLMRHRLCHHQGFRATLGGNPAVCDEIERKVEVLLQREFGCGLAGERERHFGIPRAMCRRVFSERVKDGAQ